MFSEHLGHANWTTLWTHGFVVWFPDRQDLLHWLWVVWWTPDFPVMWPSYASPSLSWPGEQKGSEMDGVAVLCSLDLWNWLGFSGRMEINGNHMVENIIPLCLLNGTWRLVGSTLLALRGNLLSASQFLSKSSLPAITAELHVCALFHLHLVMLSLQIFTQMFKSQALSFSWVPFLCRTEINILLKVQAAYGKVRIWSRLREGRTWPGWKVRMLQLRVFFWPYYLYYCHSQL